MKNIAKILNDKYYTPPELAEYCVKKTEEIIGKENITEYLEPSAGNGVFLDYLDKPYFAYDIEPEDNKNRIIQQDYLTLDLEYKKGRCIIGNPPFGRGNTLSVQFYKKSIQIGDYISFILPISQYKNNQQMFDFDLVYSEDLGERQYSNRKVHCCLNVFKRNENGLNKRMKNKFNDVEIIEVRLNNRTVQDFDLRLLAWGTGLNNLQLGGFLTDANKKYAKEFYIKIHNPNYKSEIIDLLKNVDWVKEYSMTATPNLCQWQVYKYIKEQIPEIE